MSNPNSDADLPTQISTYSSESTDLAEDYARDVEEVYLDATQSELESEMNEFFADAVDEYDPYGGLSESPVADYLSDYGSELSDIESSDDAASSTTDSAGSYTDSDAEAVASNDGTSAASTSDAGTSSSSDTVASDGSPANAVPDDGSTNSDAGRGSPGNSSEAEESSDEPSIFEYDNQISSYAEELIYATLAEGGEESADGEESSTDENESSSGSSSGSSTDEVVSRSSGTSSGTSSETASTSTESLVQNQPATRHRPTQTTPFRRTMVRRHRPAMMTRT